MVCLHPRAVTFSCVRSMNHLLSSQRSEYSTTCLFSVSTTTAPAAHRLVSSRLHMYGVCEARWRVLPSSAPAAHCGQVNWRTLTRHDHCHSHVAQVLYRFTNKPYESLKMNRPAPVEISYDCLRFLITHNPTNPQLGKFIEDLKAYGVNTLVRVCAATYDKTPVEQEGIQVLDWPFDDGSAPPEQVVDDWLNLLQVKFRDEPGCCVAVHCVAGLGRAPVLVALALIECGMEYEDAVHLIRQKRRGALNAKQLQYLENYKPKLCLRSKDANGQNCCLQ